MQKEYKGHERREFMRLDYVTPLAYKICSKQTIDKLLDGYTSNVSPSGLLCSIKEKVHKDDILWLSFDRDTLEICKDIEKQSLIYQNGVIGKVSRIEHKQDNSYSVGIRFITREEKNLDFIYPKEYFSNLQPDSPAEDDSGEQIEDDEKE